MKKLIYQVLFLLMVWFEVFFLMTSSCKHYYGKKSNLKYRGFIYLPISALAIKISVWNFLLEGEGGPLYSFIQKAVVSPS